jgi:ABC-2 type transport system ATP-binding protein
MDEAERLCDRVALVDEGRIVALDTPTALAEQAGGGKRVRFVPSRPFDDRLLTALPEVTSLDRQGHHVLVNGTGDLVNAVILTLATAGVTANEVEVQSATLEDAFVKLTGRHLHEGNEVAAG